MRRLKFRRLTAVLVTFCIFLPQSARADNPAVKLGRGFTNLATCWMELIVQPSRYVYIDDRPGLAAGAGIFQGVAYMLVRAAAGAYEVGTFPIPIPFRYKSPIRPETVFQGLDAIEKRRWDFSDKDTVKPPRWRKKHHLKLH